ncbi:cytochrome P450 [Streptomyces sp. AC602_WCS936]|uniref:cytochrome P450 n=1 Tax=Streptomyces sp. AC602_WCS936 TaxID=2823685 RepID=UPI001C2617F3|nr:cytochrome P450 [Streptomyces sp. AC602_WCS936]
MALASAERELGRRLQLVQGIHWLYGAQGDAYAALLRGYGGDPRQEYARARAAGPLWRSRLGTWVCTGYAPARRLLQVRSGAGPAAQPQSALAWDEGLSDAGELPDAGRVREAAARAARRASAELRGEVDLVAAVAARVPVEVLTDLHGLAGTDRDRLAGACAGAAGALDAALAPPAHDDAVRLLDAVGVLRELLGDAAARQAVVGVRAARELIAGVLHALLHVPESAGTAVRDPARLVTETLRHDPPVKLHAFTVAEDVEVAGERVAAGEQVAVLVGAANRDPGTFTAPDRFAPDRYAVGGVPEPLVPAPHGVDVQAFARVQAEAVLAAVAASGTLSAAGSAVRLPRCPVTWGLGRLPARVAG